jgi:hypothetical protein
MERVRFNNKDYRYFFIVFMSLFIFNENMRAIVLYKYINRLNNMIYLNVLFLSVGGVIFLKYTLRNKINKIILFISTLFMLMTLVNMYFNYLAIATIILGLTCLAFPLFFTSIEINIEYVKKIFDIFVNILNTLIILLLLYGIIDYLLKGKIQLYMAMNLLSGEMQNLILLEHSWGIYRMYSFIGHPLTNANYFLTFYCFNIINNKYFAPKVNDYLLIILTLIGLILSSSKTALIIVLFLMIFNSNSKHKVPYYVIMSIFLAVLFNTEIFQANLMKRFLDGIQSGDLSTGRNALVKQLLFNSNARPDLIFGGGIGYSIKVARSLLGQISNFEYPIIMLAFDYGIIEAILIYGIIFIYPMLIFLKNKSYSIMINFLGLFLLANTNNGLANLSDCFGVFCITIIITVSLSNYSKNIDS